MRTIRYTLAHHPEDVSFAEWYLPEYEDRQQIQRDRGTGEKIFRVTVEEATPEELNAPPGTTV